MTNSAFRSPHSEGGGEMVDRDRLDLFMFLGDYLNDAKEGFQKADNALLAMEKDHTQTGQLDEIFRVVHSLKSSSAMLEFSDIAELAHACEDLLDRVRKHELPVTRQVIDVLFEVVDTLQTMVNQRAEGKKGKPTADWGVRIAELKEKFMAQEPETAKGPGGEFADSPSRCFPAAPSIPTIEKIETVRVNVDLLDSLFDLVGELIITKNRINSIASNIPSDAVQKELKPTLTAMDRMVSELQGNVSAARLVPMSEIVQKFPRMVRDLARDANKEVELVLEGSEIELDKSVLDAISQPLIHLLRNAVDHGIEPAETRQKHNKKHQGTITLKARRTENHVLIDVEDDGGGIDIRRTKEMLVAKGLISPEEIESLEDRDVLDLLSRPGFTTAERVTDLSGRGVGLDVVQTSVKALGGTVEIATKKAKGTRFTLKLPLSTAIMQTLMVGVGDHVFAIPSDLVLEILEINPQDLKEVHNERVLVRRQEVIPFSKLSDILNIPTREDQEKPLGLIMHIGDRSISLGVDTVVGQAENVIKPFDSIAQQFRGFSGGTILADGQVALLLDVPALLNLEKLTEEVLST